MILRAAIAALFLRSRKKSVSQRDMKKRKKCVKISPDVPSGKWLMSAYLLIGRLEIFTLLFLFMPGYWKDRK